MKESIHSFLSLCSTISATIMIFCVSYYQGLSGVASIFGVPLFLGLCMFLNPIRNLYLLKKKVIHHPLYHIVVILFSLFCIQVTIQSIVLYYTGYLFDFGYEASLYFGDYYVRMILGVILLLFASLCFKKESIVKKEATRSCFFVIAMTSLFAFLGDGMDLQVALSIGLGIFSFYLFFQYRDFHTAEELQRLYFILFFLCLFTMNSVALILIVTLYFQLDQTGLHL